MRPAIDAVRETGTAVAEVALCYTADLSDPGEKLYTLDYYLKLAEQIVGAGAHVLAIKDMAGLLRPPAAARLVTALRKEFDLPVHIHTHDTAGGQLATYLAAISAGADAVDGAVASMAGHDVAAVAVGDRRGHRPHRPAPPGWTCRRSATWSRTGRCVRKVYAPFEAGLPSPTGRVYHHEIPGGQLSNLRTQAIALGLGDRFEDIEATYAAADRMLGQPGEGDAVVEGRRRPRAAPGRRGRVDPAEFEAEPDKFDIPDSVIGFLRGELGDPPGGWPEPFRTKALEGRAARRSRSRNCPKRTVPALARRPRRHAEPPAVPRRPPRSSRRTARHYGDTSACCPARTSSTACGRARSTRSTSSRACAC